MLSSYQIAQLAFGALVLGVIGERLRALYWVQATSDVGFRWLLQELRDSKVDGPQRWAQHRSGTQIARLVEVGLGSDPERLALTELLFELKLESLARLRAIRVCATLASTTGLLGGILAITMDSPAHRGLLALESGAVERAIMNEAMTTMAIGIALSAVCFQALSLLRAQADRLLVQAQQVAHSLARQGQATEGKAGSALPLPPASHGDNVREQGEGGLLATDESAARPGQHAKHERPSTE